ncbi:response regulator, partial [Salmonella enterica]|uniref:response regulator n=1 Tax=Salmonella enterica TaxID=28901 RepID=UPI003FA790C4
AEANCYDEAIAALAREHFEFVFIDLELRSAQSGMDLLQFIRGSDLGCHAIMLSANEERDTVLDCIAQGASGYITKGIGDGSIFAKAIETILGDAIFLPASIIDGSRPAASCDFDRGQSAQSIGLTDRLSEVLY